MHSLSDLTVGEISKIACAGGPAVLKEETGIHRHVRIPADEPPPPPPPTPEELELEREMEYFVEPEEAFTRDEIE